MKRRRKIPHLFAKLVVIWCIAFASGASYYALRILSRTGNDAAGLLAVILGFFGGELLFLCLRSFEGTNDTKGRSGVRKGNRRWKFFIKDWQIS